MQFMRIQVKIEVTKPLLTGFFQNIKGKKMWVNFCYEKLGDLCYHCGIIGHLKKSCKSAKQSLLEQGTEGDAFGVWLRTEEGDFSIMRVGSQLHRIETPRKDFFYSYSNEELRIEEDEPALDTDRASIQAFTNNAPFTKPMAGIPTTASGALPHASHAQPDEGSSGQNRDIMKRSPDPRAPLKDVQEKSDTSPTHHLKEGISNSNSTLTEISRVTAEKPDDEPNPRAEKNIFTPRKEQQRSDKEPSCFRIGTFTRQEENQKKMTSVGHKKKARPKGLFICEAQQFILKESPAQEPQEENNEPKALPGDLQAQEAISPKPNEQISLFEFKGEPRPSTISCLGANILENQVIQNSPSPKIRLKKRAQASTLDPMEFNILAAMKQENIKSEGGDVLNALLSKLVFALFLPYLIFTHLGPSITLKNLTLWWFIPVNVLLSTAIGCIVGLLVAIICQPPPQYFLFTVIMTAYRNTDNLPLSIVTSVCHSQDNPFGPKFHVSGVAYVAFS
ncbi:hypothetical protein FEM48_Zijuj04G0179200 [Ziziphus jujuba var. spinosa]|uniref:CCHC-type domain-containing protein n=1 Tax=Ziziphus jujuba var. spinosa TaxID=714518 RepID=A0A978VLB7_ZIZJJ|nr:hypothetical protein FEM48_Zijuj04G0179200 [Ziziphus jujuba var. spinosa]